MSVRGAGDLDEDIIERFFADRRAAGYTKLVSARAAEPLLAYLRGAGVIAPAQAPPATGPVAALLAGYERFMVCERGVLPESARDYAVKVRPFLERLLGPNGSSSADWMVRSWSRSWW